MSIFLGKEIGKYSDVDNGRPSDMSDHFHVLVWQIKAQFKVSEQRKHFANKV